MKCPSSSTNGSGVLQKQHEEDNKPIPPPRVSSVKPSGNKRSKLQPPSAPSVNPSEITTKASKGESQHSCSRINTNSGNSIQGQKADSVSPNHTDVHVQGHLSRASNHCISAHSIQACSAMDNNSIMSIQQQQQQRSASAVTTCANTPSPNTTSCKNRTPQQPEKEQLQTRSPGASSTSSPASSSSPSSVTSHDNDVTAQSAVYTSSDLPLDTTTQPSHGNGRRSSSRKSETALPSSLSSSTCDCNDCNYNKNTNITQPKHCGHTHGATEDKYIKKQYHSRSSSSGSSKQTQNKSSAQNVSISGPNSKSQKDVFCSRHLNDDDISASSQNPQSSTDSSHNPRNNTVHSSHSNHGSHSDVTTNGTHCHSNNKPLSAIPGRVSRLHHEMERKYSSFSSGSSSCSSGASTHSSPSPEHEPEDKGFFVPTSFVKGSHNTSPPHTEIPKRTFLKDSGLPSYNQTKGATSAIPRDVMSHSHPTSAISRIRPTSASSASSHSKSAKPSVAQVSRSAPGSPTRAAGGGIARPGDWTHSRPGLPARPPEDTDTLGR